MSTDSVIMLRRNCKHTVRNPTAVFNAILFPVVLMLMFVFVIGGAFNVGVSYVDYATPGMIVLAICYGLSATALAVNSDMTKGIINRFKVMDISRSAVLSAHVVASMLRSLVAQGTPDELKHQIPGSHVRLRFTNVLELDAAARVLTGSTRDDEDLALRVPSDGGVKSLRALLGQLDEHSINPEEFSVHTPDLDDVFLALTGHPNTEEIAR